MKLLLSLLAILTMLDVCWSQCRTANWWGAFDHKGWVKCGYSTEYLTGFYRNNFRGDKDYIYLLEEGSCCKAPAPNQNQPSTCTNANWWGTLDSNNRWAVCPNGYFLQGLYRNDGNWLHHIEEGRCCKPNNLPSSYLGCYNKDVAASFDNKGWSKCDTDYYMAGFYKGGCDKLQCIEKFKCCSMYDGCKMANWWGKFDQKGWVYCDSSTQYITGLWRNNNRGSEDRIVLLEEAKCCPAPAPDQNTPSTCQNVNWWGILDGTNVWANCPTGYFIQGFYRNTGDWLHHIEEAKCCKPNTFPNRYEHCYNEDIKYSFDNIGISKCKHSDYYVAGIYKGGCDKLHCIETLKCCKMNIDECRVSNPCKNGATCSDTEGSYNCACKSGYTGKNCDVDVNECTNSPCKNGATCVNLAGSYRCDCKSGYTGSNCETDVNECTNSPCQNGAKCVNLAGSYRCECKSGYTGSKCESDINECTNSPCKNGATCVNLRGRYRCDCKSGYTGNNCQTDINECTNSPCKNGATCVNLAGSYRCDCASGFTGSNCETDWEAPVLTCPGPEFTVNNDKGKNVATVNWDFSFTDNSLRENEPGITINSFTVLLKINGKNVDTTLPKLMGIGKNNVEYNVIDAVGNSGKCGFTVDVKDSEPPVFTFCPTDILIDNATEVEMRFSWQQPIASDNSGVPPSLSSNREPGEPFSVPGSYQIVYKAVDGSGNEATCSFRITVQKKSCTLYSAPQNGALACRKVGSDPMCAVMCKSGSDFVFNPPLLYLCSAGKWQYYSLPSMPYERTLPWPDCSANSNPSSISEMKLPYYFFNGDVNDPNVIDAIKDNFISLLKQPYVPPIFCQYDPQCNKDNVEVKVQTTR